MLKFIALAISLLLVQNVALAMNECAPEHLADYYLQAQVAAKTNDWQSARKATQQLSHCLPQRGDLRVDLLRYALLLHDYPAARQEFDWLQRQPLPPALERIITSWMQQAPAIPISADSRNLHTSVTLTGGYNSNANDGSRHRLVPVNLGGLSLLWRLDNASTAQPSSLVGAETRLDYSAGSHGLSAVLDFTHYTDLDARDLGATFAYTHLYDCRLAGECRLSALVNGREEFGNRRYQALLGTSVSTSHQLWNTYVRYSHEPSGATSHSAGLQASYLLTPQILLHGGLEYDRSPQPRAGGTRAQWHLGTRIQPLHNSNLQMTLLHLREHDQTAWSPALWGQDRRDRKFSKLGLEYRQNLGPGWSLKLEGDYRRTNSAIPIYQQHGWSIGLGVTYRE